MSAKKKLKRLQLREKLYTIFEASLYLGVPYADFYREVTNSRLPLPARRIGNKIRVYYSKEDLEEIQKLIE